MSQCLAAFSTMHGKLTRNRCLKDTMLLLSCLQALKGVAKIHLGNMGHKELQNERVNEGVIATCAQMHIAAANESRTALYLGQQMWRSIEAKVHGRGGRGGQMQLHFELV